MRSVTLLVVFVTADIVPLEKFGTTGTARAGREVKNISVNNLLIFCGLDVSFHTKILIFQEPMLLQLVFAKTLSFAVSPL